MIDEMPIGENESENNSEAESESIEIECFVCKTFSSQRWAIDPNYIVCPKCCRLYEIRNYY